VPDAAWLVPLNPTLASDADAAEILTGEAERLVGNAPGRDVHGCPGTIRHDADGRPPGWS
jgi:hypothetical protein